MKFIVRMVTLANYKLHAELIILIGLFIRYSILILKERSELNIKTGQLFANCFIVIISHILSCNSECSINFLLQMGQKFLLLFKIQDKKDLKNRIIKGLRWD